MPAHHLLEADNLLAMVEGLPGDPDSNVAAVVESTRELFDRDRTSNTLRTAMIGAEAGIFRSISGEDADSTVYELKQGSHEAVEAALTEFASIKPGGDVAVQEFAKIIGEAEGERKQESVIESIDSAKYVSEVLKKNPEVRDNHDRPRPTYEINGRTVVFRNRMENVDIPNNGVTVVAAATVRPLSISSLKKDVQEQYRQPLAEVNSFNQKHANDSEGNILSVPNTPLGIVEAAIMLGAENVMPLRDKLLRGEYADPECQKLVDGLLGATTVDDNGEALERYDTDGFAVVLSSLAGNESARRIVETKSVALIRLEAERKQYNKEKGEQYIRERQEKGNPLPESLPIEKMFMVHSTSHELEFDEQGNAIFIPSGQYEETGIVPRASWHVTINSGVFPHAKSDDAWGAQNRLVVAPLTEVMRETPRLEVLDGVDAWVVVSPGEQVKVPSPTIIEATTSGEELVQRHGNTVRFLLKEHYNEDEQQQIALLAGQYGAISIDSINGKDTLGADTLKEACLQMVLSEKGLSREERDRPATDGHGMANNLLAQRIMATAYTAGIRSGPHFHQLENNIEDQGPAQVLKNLTQKLLNPDKVGANTGASPDYGAAIGARRQALVNGCLPAAPQIVPVEIEQDLWA